MSVSIKQLKAFVAVVEEKSFSLAADRLNATQSGMSMLVQNLELHWKKLLDRVPGNMKLKVEKIFINIDDILNQWKRL